MRPESASQRARDRRTFWFCHRVWFRGVVTPWPAVLLFLFNVTKAKVLRDGSCHVGAHAPCLFGLLVVGVLVSVTFTFAAAVGGPISRTWFLLLSPCPPLFCWSASPSHILRKEQKERQMFQPSCLKCLQTPFAIHR